MGILDSETTVIGASLSGSLAAYLLAQDGKNVALIDPMPFPRRKACGEGLSILGKEYLEACGLWTRELAQAALPFYGYTVNQQDGTQIRLTDKHRSIQGFGVSRLVLDSIVQQRAHQLASVSSIKSRVTEIEDRQEHWLIQLNDGNILRAKHLILAGGARSATLLSTTESSATTFQRYAMAFWCEGEWQNDLPQTVAIFQQPEGQYIITPLSNQTINFSVLLRRASPTPVTRNEVLEKAQRLAERFGFRVLTCSDPLGMSSVHSTQPLNHHRALLVGDAVERFDPIGGMGMTHAIYTAMLAADRLKNSSSATEAASQYYKKRLRAARVLRAITNISFELNARNRYCLNQLASAFPELTMRGMNAVKGCFPKPHKFSCALSNQSENTRGAKISVPSFGESQCTYSTP